MGDGPHIKFEDLPPELKGEGPIQTERPVENQANIERGSILRALQLIMGIEEKLQKY